MIKDQTPPEVTFSPNWGEGKLCVSITEFELGCTGISEATLLDGAKVISQYAASPEKNKPPSLKDYLSSGGKNGFCLTTVPFGKFLDPFPGTSSIIIPTPETLAAVKDVVVIAKDFAGNEARITYSETDDFKELSEKVKDWERLKSERANLLKKPKL